MEDAGGKEYPLYLVWRTNTLTQGEGTADYSRTQDAAWTPKPKMSSDEWAALVPSVRAAVDEAYGEDVPPRPWVWHDNERFLLCPEVYSDNGMSLHRFPPNSGDLNPIEIVWAWLRKDLAVREQ